MNDRVIFQREGMVHNTKRIISFLRMGRAHIGFLILSIILSVCSSIAALYSLRLLMRLARGIVSGEYKASEGITGMQPIANLIHMDTHSSWVLFVTTAVWLYMVILLKNVFHYYSSLTSQNQARIAVSNVRRTLIEKCLSYSKSFYDENTKVYIHTVLTRSTQIIQQQFRMVHRIFSQLLLQIVYVSVMFVISWRLTCVAIVIIPVTGLLTHRLISRVREASRGHDRVSKELNEKIYNMLHCIPVIRSYAKEKEEIEKFSKASDEEIQQAYQTERLTSLSDPIEDLGTTTGLIIIAIGLAYGMRNAPLDPAQTFIFIFLTIRLARGMNVYIKYKIGSMRAAAALDDIEQVLQYSQKERVISGTDEFMGLRESIDVNNLTFKYTGSQVAALENISFSIKKGSVLAVVGASGSGKSTLMNLLLRFYDCPPGSITIDGMDIRDFNLNSLRKKISIVSQETLLFNDTVRNNIAYGVEGAVSDEELHGLGKKIRVHHFVKEMPRQYDTSIGEGGERLSRGESQRLSIARALIKEPEILIMDEATSALDSVTESQIHDFIMRNKGDKTIIVIAHRLSTISDADNVIYLDRGRIREQGVIGDLIDKKGLFFKQWRRQRVKR